ncbi:hypothetical protein [Inquilinus sp.]|uniref:hypothetical protein n=1 Tax=Inquilinus sp. TaxID=1932117 RepID=UPI0031DADA80
MRPAAVMLAAGVALLASTAAWAAPPAETPAAPLSCGGSEPFWSLTLDAGGKARFSDGDGRELSSRYTLQPSRNTTLMAGATFGPGGSLRAVIINNACVEDMSDGEGGFVYEIAVFDGDRLLSGCCKPG